LPLRRDGWKDLMEENQYVGASQDENIPGYSSWKNS